MTKISEVLSGILKDITLSRVAADLLAKEHYEAYQSNELLSKLPIPRFRYRDVNVKLRFVIDSVVGPDYSKADLSVYEQEWLKHLKDKGLTETCAKAIGETKLASTVEASLKKSAEATKAPSFDLSAALAGDTKAMLAASVAFLTSARTSAPTKVKSGLPTAAKYKSVAGKAIAEDMNAFLESTRKKVAASQAADTGLDVLLTKSALESVRESDILEMTFSLSPDDLQMAQSKDSGTNPGEANNGSD